MTTRKKIDAPFYVKPQDKKTSSEIINEARQSVREVKTKRPFTPRDSKRTLFGGSTRTPDRPPSAFSLGARHFDGCDSRPVSATRLAPLEHKPPLPVSSSSPPTTTTNDISPKIPKPPPNDAHRTGSGKRFRAKLPSIGADGEGILPSMPGRRGSFPSKAPESPPEEFPRRVHSGPKERTKNFFDEKLDDEMIRSSSAGTIRTTRCDDKICKLDVGKRDDESQEDALYWNTKVLPIIETMESKTKSASVEEIAKLCNSCDLLYSTLESANMLGRTSKRRSSVLKPIYRLLDIDNPKLMLKLARLILAFKVTGNNLTNVCKLVFKVSREETNDTLFMQHNILDLVLEIIHNTDPQTACEALVYCVGALKFLTGNTSLLKELSECGCVEALAKLLISINTAKCEGEKSSNQKSNLLLQVTATFRNLADLGANRHRFITSFVIQELCKVMECYPSDSDLMLNVSRILSKLTLNNDCCSTLSRYPTCFKSFLKLLHLHQRKSDLVVRVCFVLGNLTSKNDEARTSLYNTENSMKILLGVFKTYFKLDVKELQEKLSPSKKDQNKSSNKVEDVLIKLVRVIANLSINQDIGPVISSDVQCVDLLLQILEYKDVLQCEELVLNTVATINNLSYYGKKTTTISERQIEISELLVKILMTDNMDGMIEASRVFGNLSRNLPVREFISEKKVDEMMVTLLDAGNREVVYIACGVLINLMIDEKRRPKLKDERGIKKLIDVLRDFGRNDWQLAGMVCMTLWNYSEKITTSSLAFGEQETNQLIELLEEYLDEETAIDVPSNADLDEETKDFLKSVWERDFCPVAHQLLNRVEKHHTDLVPLEQPDDERYVNERQK
ncbi:armadillo repeat-containing protein 2-like [Saccoglossus kowalevskii]|uniref:Armadillo repeat-containing protein 2-like n=1 Tax=Saccoglossus kowalevskii TaxID=10224 RepID=A0ABM0M7I5_SACKO|nr:PREDICTED: armadillo repeat-containing protein 2-like [Saccoglossus kowalevskii]